MKRKWLAGICLTLSLLTVGTLASCNGLSAYDIAVKNGFIGTEVEWLESLKGINGTDGSSVQPREVYNDLVEKGEFSGTYEEFLKEYLNGDVIINDYTDADSFDKSCMLSVVAVRSQFVQKVPIFDRWNWVTGYETQVYESYGAGVIYQLDKEQGSAYIITNYHVVYDSESIDGISTDIDVYLYGMESLTSYYYANDYAIHATFVGGSSTQDIAVLKVEDNAILRRSKALAARMGDSNSLQVGDTVYTVGNPSAEGLSVCGGIISKENDYITMSAIDGSNDQTLFRVIRTDAAVNSGNSGGGLFNANGELVGIVNAKSVATNVESMGYALPSSLVQPLVENIRDNCEGTNNEGALKALFGINIRIVSAYPEYDAQTGSLTMIERPGIDSVNKGCAADGKLQAGDVIWAIQIGDTVTYIDREHEFGDILYNIRKGDTVIVTVQRGIQMVDVEITFDQDSYFTQIK